MKVNKWRVTVIIMVASLFVSLDMIAQQSADTAWTKQAARKWFNQKAWLHGVALMPHETIDQQELARQYHLNKTYWDEAFLFLKEHDLATLPKGKYPIDGENVYATVTEDSLKDLVKTNWESHRRYIDIQCVIKGEEKMGISPIVDATVTKQYDEKKDAANYTAEGKYYTGKAGTVFIFFPSTAHRPNISPGERMVEKKIVIKLRYN